MTDIDLSTLSLQELKALLRDVTKAVDSYEDRKKAEARAILEAQAKELGFSLAEIAESAPKRMPAVAKYRHPENPELTWSGRGRKPKWIAEYTESGKSLADLEI